MKLEPWGLGPWATSSCHCKADPGDIYENRLADRDRMKCWAWDGLGEMVLGSTQCEMASVGSQIRHCGRGIIDEGLWIKNCGRMDWEDTDLELRAWKCGVGMQTFEFGRASIK